MFQEIITYMIIGSAATLTIIKIANRFKRKKPNKQNAPKGAVNSGHNCSSCSAECALRDLPQKKIKLNTDLCKKVEIKSKSF